MEIKKRIPQSENIRETIVDGDVTYYVTSDRNKTKFILYKKVPGGVALIATGKTPPKVKQKMEVSY